MLLVPLELVQVAVVAVFVAVVPSVAAVAFAELAVLAHALPRTPYANHQTKLAF